MARESEPMENLKKYRKSGLEHFIKFVRELPVIPPKKIFTRLEEAGYRGQEPARRLPKGTPSPPRGGGLSRARRSPARRVSDGLSTREAHQAHLPRRRQAR